MAWSHASQSPNSSALNVDRVTLLMRLVLKSSKWHLSCPLEMSVRVSGTRRSSVPLSDSPVSSSFLKAESVITRNFVSVLRCSYLITCGDFCNRWTSMLSIRMWW